MGDVIIASTTDDQNAVNAAAGGKPQDEEQPKLKEPPTGDQQVENQEAEEQAPAEKQPEKHEEGIAPKGVEKRIGKLRAQLTAAQKEIEDLKKALGNNPAISSAPSVEEINSTNVKISTANLEQNIPSPLPYFPSPRWQELCLTQ